MIPYKSAFGSSPFGRTIGDSGRYETSSGPLGLYDVRPLGIGKTFREVNESILASARMPNQMSSRPATPSNKTQVTESPQSLSPLGVSMNSLSEADKLKANASSSTDQLNNLMEDDEENKKKLSSVRNLQSGVKPLV